MSPARQGSIYAHPVNKNDGQMRDSSIAKHRLFEMKRRGRSMSIKAKIIMFLVLILVIIGLVVYFSYFFNAPRKDAVLPGAGMRGNLTVTVFGNDGKIIKRWTGMKRAAARDAATTNLFTTREGKSVQIGPAVWFIAEEE